MQGRSSFTIQLLGPIAVRAADGRDLTPPGRKLRALLTCLAIARDNGWERDKLSALLWSDRDEEQARGSLRQALAELRKLLGEPSPLRADRETIAFDHTLAKVDVADFERLAAAGAVEEAVALYRGDLMDGQIPSDPEFAAWLCIERTRLHDRAIQVLTRLAGAQDGQVAISTVQRLLEIDPSREESHRMLMRLYAAAGERAGALRQYQVCRETLQRELDVVPDLETERLLKQIQSSGNGATASQLSTPSRAETPASAISAPAPRRRFRLWHLAPICLGFLLAGAAIFQFYPRPSEEDGFPSLVILPFDNLSGEPALQSYADGIHDDVVTMASHFPDLSVVASKPNAGAKDPVNFARELGADYVLTGSVQRKGAGLRVNAQLIDVHTSRNIWADGSEGDKPALLQDEAVRKIIVSITGEKGAIKQSEYEHIKRKPTTLLTEYEYYLRGHQFYMRAEDIETLDRAGMIWLQGLEKYPDSSLLRVKLGWYYFARPWNFNADKPAADERKAGEYARAALASQNPSPMVQRLGHWLMAYIHWHEGDFTRAVQDAETVAAINPYDADAMSFLARVQLASGNPERAIEWVQSSSKLDPNVPRDTRVLAWAYYLMGDYGKSIAAAEKHVKLSREFADDAYLFIAADAARLGRFEEAHDALDAHIKAVPNWSSLAAERAWALDWPYKDPAVLERWLADLAAAGYPDLPFGESVKGYERLTVEEVRALTFGHTVRGRDLDTGKTYVDVTAPDGSIQETGDYGPDTAVINYSNDGLICYRWTEWGTNCGRFFRKVTSSGKDELLNVSACCRWQISVD